MVSVVGAGGVGKTRLAQTAARTLRDAFADGVWMVELAPVADPALLPAAVAQALGLALPGRASAQDECVDALKSRALLLVLDNCEHLIDAASRFVEAVVVLAPHSKMLATSQELRLSDTAKDESPSFSPNGKYIMYATDSGRRGALAVVSVDGRVRHTLSTQAGDIREPTWGPFMK